MRELPSLLNDIPDGPAGYRPLCPECQTGAMRLERQTYFTWLNDELVTVQNFPAWICDICGRREYDTRAITWLNTLLNPEAGRKSQPRKQKPAGPGKRPAL